MLASYGWLRKERGLLAITGAVAGIQLLSHGRSASVTRIP